MQRYPEVARFVFEAGRVANARKDFAEARRLYDKAAAAGYPMAMNNIGGMYEGGYGVRVDYAEAARWYRRRSTPASRSRWSISAGSRKRARREERLRGRVRLYETAVKAGIPSAMNNLGLLYLRGNASSRDYTEARRLFEQGIALGDAACMNGMGVIYNEGDGVARNGKLARQWYRESRCAGRSRGPAKSR